MGIAVNEDHLELESVVRAFLANRKVREATRDGLEVEEEPLPEFWAEASSAGWVGLPISEEHGGSGFGLGELVIVAEQLGRAVAPGPFLPTAAAGAFLQACGTEDQRAALLPGIAAGRDTVAVAVDSDLDANADQVSGKVLALVGADPRLLLIGLGEDVWVLPSETDGVVSKTPANVDLTRSARSYTLTEVDASAGYRLPGSRSYLRAVVQTLASAEAVGGCLDCVDASVGYAKIREQFGRPIATFQAVKHHCANMIVAAEVAAAVTWDAARAAVEDRAEFEYLASASAALALPGYVKNAQTNIQVHGGIGFTWEHDAHLHLRRAIVLDSLYSRGSAEAVLAGAAAGVRRASSIELPPEAEAIRERVREFVATLEGLDEKALRSALVESGYAVPHWPIPYGLAAGPVEQIVIEQEFAAADLARPEYSITGWVVLTMIQHGTTEQVERFVKKALLGEEEWCQLFSEPAAGSDAAAVRTKATKVDGGWIINGQKVWTSGAQRSQWGVATVRTDPDAAKHDGITQVIIDMNADGVEVRPLRQITGGSEFNEVFFTDVFVPDEHVIGEVNKGWTVARATLGNERVGIGGGVAGSLGTIDMTVELANTYAADVAGSGARIGRFLAEEEALRLLNLRRVVRSVSGAPAGPEGNVTKLVLAEHLHERAAISQALVGPDTVFAAGPGKYVAYMVLASRGMSIAGGTSEITRNQIAERILGMPRDPLIK